MGLPNPSRETKFSGANGDREIFIFPVQLTTSRIGNLTHLMIFLLYVMTIHFIVFKENSHAVSSWTLVVVVLLNGRCHLVMRTQTHPEREKPLYEKYGFEIV